ncbi:hypothetical protein BT96DRAFT_523372 [Gymnopus androsaceus JB14]|uniref:Uncharacterized protein n=1 Tax=Gymnopus androsaceus JB14 TaxID=1447944 RepID=A0A6A4GLX8_9AGAR|nr:hypothetical protein BT96DRAFT_523372 [Gymnopus androsaceus JB14]
MFVVLCNTLYVRNSQYCDDRYCEAVMRVCKRVSHKLLAESSVSPRMCRNYSDFIYSYPLRFTSSYYIYTIALPALPCSLFFCWFSISYTRYLDTSLFFLLYLCCSLRRGTQ